MRSSESQNVIIYTIGHSNLDLERFLDLLKKNEIEVLVDVRSVPFSRYVPQFNMKNIKEKIKSAGIEYIFMEDEHAGNVLGGRPRDMECYENGKIVYEYVMEKSWYKEGISALIELADEKRTAVMCSEEDPYRCHRHLMITQSLIKKDAIVLHIRKDGRKEEVKKEKKTVQKKLF
ncbi:MAG: hypothetical protein MASP_00592 [Candidatus Methanolliviera sp. GoM_asphalt]|nr:MAG: hypothetical protein MASP_00592 [Candidatus Methanolliviera sp. GoM_asphalt]